MSYSFWPLDDTIDRKHLVAVGRWQWWWELEAGKMGGHWGKLYEKVAVLLHNRHSKQLDIMSIFWRMPYWAKSTAYGLFRCHFFYLNGHHWYFWQSTESWACLYRSKSLIQLLLLFVLYQASPLTLLSLSFLLC